MTTIKLKNGSGAPTAGDLVQGEPALDLTNKRLYTEDSVGTVIEVGTNPTSVTTGAITATGIDVTGTVTADGANIDGAVTTGDITIDNDDTPTLNFKKDSSADILGTINVSTDAGSGGKMVFQTKRNGNTALDRMVIDDDGNVGIGTTAPSGVRTKIKGLSEATSLATSATSAALFIEPYSGSTWGLGIGSISGQIQYIQGVSAAGDASRNLAIQPYGGNVGIGVTPAYKLDVSGSVRLKTGATGTPVIVSTGGDSQGTLRFGSASTEYSINGGADYLAMIFNANGSERMRIDSTGNLRVGVGNTFEPVMQFTNSGRVEGNPGFTFNGDLDTGMFNPSTQGTIAFSNNGSESMRLDASGNLLVGTTDTTLFNNTTGGGFSVSSNGFTQIAKQGADNADPVLILNQTGLDGEIQRFYKDGSSVGSIGADGGAIYIGNTAGEKFKFHNGSGGSFYPATDNNNDLGATSNRFKDLYLSGNLNATSTGSLHSQIVSSGGDAKLSLVCSDSHDAWINFSGATNEMSLGYDRTTSSLIFSNGDTLGSNPRMSLTSAGNLLVGKTAASTSGAGSYFEPSSVINYGRVNFISEVTAANPIVFYYDNGSTSVAVGVVSTTTTSTTYGTSSDQRLKENIVDAPSASDDIDAIQVRSFDWKADGSHQKYGMVAQELVTVAPEAVQAPEDPEEMMGVDYSKLVPMLVKEIQSLRARVAQLETN